MRQRKWAITGVLLCATAFAVSVGLGRKPANAPPPAPAEAQTLASPAWPAPVFVGGNQDWSLRIDTTATGARVYSLRVPELPDPPKGRLEDVGDPSHPGRYVLEGPVRLPPKFEDTLVITIIPLKSTLPCFDSNLKRYDHALIVRMTTTGVWTGCGTFKPH
ncbi:MAG: hypothetical protein E6Q88_04035 [Lysobacteraceae bacterium]|nr:MAG: hypothetical protein E6Q88_04035 [Xanthomonadaceae bacterium]